jgi:amidase
MARPSLDTLPATEPRRLIGNKEISPVELLEACIARIEALDPAVNAIAARAFDTVGGLRRGPQDRWT